jgi:hypothetical protein
MRGLSLEYAKVYEVHLGAATAASLYPNSKCVAPAFSDLSACSTSLRTAGRVFAEVRVSYTQGISTIPT